WVAFGMLVVHGWLGLVLLLLVRVLVTQLFEYVLFNRFHCISSLWLLVVIAFEVQHAVYGQVRPVRIEALTLLLCLARNDCRADREVAEQCVRQTGRHRE